MISEIVGFGLDPLLFFYFDSLRKLPGCPGEKTTVTFLSQFGVSGQTDLPVFVSLALKPSLRTT